MSENLNEEEKELLKDFNKLNEKDQEFIMKLLEIFVSKNKDNKFHDKNTIKH